MDEDEFFCVKDSDRRVSCYNQTSQRFSLGLNQKREFSAFFANKSIEKDYENDLLDWKKYKFHVDYSTHDLLPDIALDINARSRTLITQERETFWNDKRRQLFLYATAGPDEFKYKVYDIGPDLEPIFKERERFVSYFGKCLGLEKHVYELGPETDSYHRSWHLIQIDKDTHQIQDIIWWFNRDAFLYNEKHYPEYPLPFFHPIKTKYNCASRAQYWYDMAVKFFKKKCYNHSAFCLGLMTHYMVDASCFYHLFDPYGAHVAQRGTLNNYDYEVAGIFSLFIKRHNYFENMVSSRTDSCNKNNIFSKTKETRNKFFYFYEDIIHGKTKSVTMSAKEATYSLALRILMAKPDINWLDKAITFFRKEEAKIEGFESIWPHNHYLDSKLDWHESPKWINLYDGLMHRFLSKIEEHLNWAIESLCFVFNSFFFDCQ